MKTIKRENNLPKTNVTDPVNANPINPRVTTNKAKSSENNKPARPDNPASMKITIVVGTRPNLFNYNQLIVQLSLTIRVKFHWVTNKTQRKLKPYNCNSLRLN